MLQDPHNADCELDECEIVFDQPPSPAQAHELAVYDRFLAVSTLLYDRLFPLWQAVAEQGKAAPWLTSRSTDTLTFFTHWLLLEAPRDKAQWFLNTNDVGQLEAELSANYRAYVAEDNYLMGCNASDEPRKAVQAAMARFPDRFNV
eukprot:TRINITY_DN3608_c0_g1_i2.p1 TRINITY_DN3608_c0_g1~~TRINITY_DN3608_c0_g1_i2.p1  ORF type:complete len:146 (+),score=11.33 TRINITY_DN3608_c0_g1_i2:144-581(+)